MPGPLPHIVHTVFVPSKVLAAAGALRRPLTMQHLKCKHYQKSHTYPGLSQKWRRPAWAAGPRTLRHCPSAARHRRTPRLGTEHVPIVAIKTSKFHDPCPWPPCVRAPPPPRLLVGAARRQANFRGGPCSRPTSTDPQIWHRGSPLACQHGLQACCAGASATYLKSPASTPSPAMGNAPRLQVLQELPWHLQARRGAQKQSESTSAPWLVCRSTLRAPERPAKASADPLRHPKQRRCNGQNGGSTGTCPADHRVREGLSPLTEYEHT